jgi:hypothetical protein
MLLPGAEGGPRGAQLVEAAGDFAPQPVEVMDWRSKAPSTRPRHGTPSMSWSAGSPSLDDPLQVIFRASATSRAAAARPAAEAGPGSGTACTARG